MIKSIDEKLVLLLYLKTQSQKKEIRCIKEKLEISMKRVTIQSEKIKFIKLLM